MKRQTKSQGVVARWAATPLDVDPFNLPGMYDLRLTGKMHQLLRSHTKISLNSHSIFIQTLSLDRILHSKRLRIKDFLGIAMRISIWDHDTGTFAISINLHHNQEKYCIPLHFAFDMDISGARIQTWSRVLGLPILLPAMNGQWHEPVERFGRLKIRPPIRRSARSVLHTRKSIIPAYREACSIDPNKKIAGKELIARS